MLDAEMAAKNTDDSETAMLSIIDELVQDQCLGLAFEVHRACKTGAFLIGDTDPESQNFALINRPGYDVLGQTPTKKNFECQCPHCFRPLAAQRFAPHLEKCMGMGRNSSRIASRRIANNTKRDSEESNGDDDNDNDWSYGTENKKVKKLKREKGVNSPRNKKASKMKNGHSGHHGSVNGPHSSQDAAEAVLDTPNYDHMTIEDRKALLLNSCGVISEHTKKMCTRTLKCPQHSDEQRRQVRHLLLRTNRQQQQQTAEREDMVVDIDTCDDTETQSLRESLQWEASSNSSPADSTSTNNNLTVGLYAGTTSSHKRPAKSSHKHSGGGTSGTSKSKKHKSSSKPPSSSSSKDSASTSLYDFTS